MYLLIIHNVFIYSKFNVLINLFISWSTSRCVCRDMKQVIWAEQIEVVDRKEVAGYDSIADDAPWLRTG